MFKLSLGVYLKSYKYIWVPIVILAVFMGIGAVILYFGAKDLLTNVSTELKAISGDFNFDANDVISFMVKSVDEIGTGKVDAINYKFLIEKVLEFIKEHNPSYEAYEDNIRAIVESHGENINIYFIIFLICTFLGIFGGFFFTSFLIAKKNVKHSLFKTIIVLIFNATIAAAILTLATFLLTKWVPSAIIVAVALLLINSFIMLFEAYMLQKDDKLKFRDVISFKNVFLLLICNLFMIAFSVGISFGLFYIPIKIIPIILIYSIVILTIADFKILAESYVQKLKEGKI